MSSVVFTDIYHKTLYNNKGDNENKALAKQLKQ